MPTSRPLIHWLLLFALVAMWGTSFTINKIAVAAFEPTSVVAARLVIAAAALVPGVLIVGRRLPGWDARWKYFAAMAVIGNCVPFSLITWGQQRIDAGLAGILMAVMPLATMVLASRFVEGEPLTARKAAGFGLGFVGIVVLMGPSALGGLGGDGLVLLSQLAVLGGAVCYAIATIVARRGPAGDAIVNAAGVSVVGAAVMAPVAIAVDAPPVVLPLDAALCVAALGLVSTALATVVYFRLVAMAGASFLSLINYLIPIWAVGVGMAALGERPEWSALVALVLVLSGIAVSERGLRLRRSRP